MSTETQPEALATVTIDPVGDVTLITQTQEIRVSSKVLSAASKVFSTIFQPRFREGADLAKDGTCRVPLPEDDPKAIHQLCEVLHDPQGEDYHYCLIPSLLEKIAILVDKYQCTETIYYWARTVFTRMGVNRLSDGGPRWNSAACMQILYATYTMNIPCQFNAITNYMVFSKVSYLHDETKDGNKTLCWTIDSDPDAVLPDGLLGEPQTYF